MWQCILSNHFSIHYLWLIALFTQFMITICNKNTKPKKAGPKENSRDSKEPIRSTSVSTEKTGTASKEPNIMQTQASAENAEETPFSGYNMSNVKKFVDENKSVLKTDLRSLEDNVFIYNPKKPLGDVRQESQKNKPPAPPLKPEQRTQMVPVDRPEEREMSLLAPGGCSTNQPPANSLRPITTYDPLAHEKAVPSSLQKPPPAQARTTLAPVPTQAPAPAAPSQAPAPARAPTAPAPTAPAQAAAPARAPTAPAPAAPARAQTAPAPAVPAPAPAQARAPTALAPAAPAPAPAPTAPSQAPAPARAPAVPAQAAPAPARAPTATASVAPAPTQALATVNKK
ncbi:hypothetical protein GCK32_004578 [Trichostrongylus colubriformis]|uniref:Uncharacterized protein n=1 Tax=Trichostrongylus colubriformis TaxID=6319 RepID=A0AAN8IR17_TRICO